MIIACTTTTATWWAVKNFTAETECRAELKEVHGVASKGAVAAQAAEASAAEANDKSKMLRARLVSTNKPDRRINHCFIVDLLDRLAQAVAASELALAESDRSSLRKQLKHTRAMLGEARAALVSSKVTAILSCVKSSCASDTVVAEKTAISFWDSTLMSFT